MYGLGACLTSRTPVYRYLLQIKPETSMNSQHPIEKSNDDAPQKRTALQTVTVQV